MRQQQVLAVERTLPVRVSPRELVWLLWRDPSSLRGLELEALGVNAERIPVIAVVGRLVRSFLGLLRGKDAEAVGHWLAQARACGVRDVELFAESLERERSVLEAAVALPWSQGPVEGVVNKIKLSKRQMFGRASVLTLRSRVLLALEHHS